MATSAPPTLCKCGCGSAVRRGSVFVRGHQARHPDYVRRPRSECPCGSPATVRGRCAPCFSAIERERLLMWKYGITTAEYAELYAAQAGVCAICGGTEDEKPLSVDHDHATGAVRGLLCTGCNHMLGKAQDDPVRLRVAADYLERRA